MVYLQGWGGVIFDQGLCFRTGFVSEFVEACAVENVCYWDMFLALDAADGRDGDAWGEKFAGGKGVVHGGGEVEDELVVEVGEGWVLPLRIVRSGESYVADGAYMSVYLKMIEGGRLTVKYLLIWEPSSPGTAGFEKWQRRA